MLKGIQYIVPAFKRFLEIYPNARLLIANTHGSDEKLIRGMLNTISKANLIEVKYERDMAALYHSLHMYVHTPINEHCEAFGQTYIEALIAGVPSIFTLSGVAREFIKNEKNALVVDFQNEDEILKAMLKIMSDKNLAKAISAQGYKDVADKFKLSLFLDKLERIYLS